MRQIWKMIREFFRGPDVEVGQIWECVIWNGDPFVPKVIRTFEVLDVRDGYAKGRYEDGRIDSFRDSSLRFLYGLRK